MMAEVRANTQIHVHDTPDAIYDALVRVSLERKADTSRWVTLRTANDIEVTFFGIETPDTKVADAEAEVLA